MTRCSIACLVQLPGSCPLTERDSTTLPRDSRASTTAPSSHAPCRAITVTARPSREVATIRSTWGAPPLRAIGDRGSGDGVTAAQLRGASYPSSRKSHAGTVAGPRLVASRISPRSAPVTVSGAPSPPPPATSARYDSAAPCTGRFSESPSPHRTVPSPGCCAGSLPPIAKWRSS